MLSDDVVNSLKPPRWIKRSCLMAAMSLAGAVPLARADWSGNWSNTTYTDTTNWSSSTINDTFSGAVLGLTARTALLPEVGDIDYGTAGATLAGYENGWVFTPTDGLAASSGIALTIAPSTAASRTVQLNGNVLVQVGPDNGAATSSSQTIALGTASRPLDLDLAGGTRTLRVNTSAPAGDFRFIDTLRIYGSMSNGNVIKDGWGDLSIRENQSLAGSFTISQGTARLEIDGAGTTDFGTLAQISQLNLSGIWTRLLIDTGTATTNDRLNDNAPVTFNGGVLHLKGNAGASGTSETIGAVMLESARSYIGYEQASAGAVMLNITSLSRSNNATVVIGGTATMGSTNKVIVTNATSSQAIVSDLVGGGGAAGSKNISILPWANYRSINVGTTDNSWYSVSNDGTVGGFVTYDSANGFRPLNFSEYATTLASAGPTDNVRLATNETSGNRTVNSIYTTTGVAITIGSGNTLAVTSGAIALGGATTIGSAANDGTLAFGEHTGYIYGRQNLTVNSGISGGTVVFATIGGTVSLNGSNNSWSGDTVVQGNLATVNNNVLPDTTALKVANTGVFTLGSGRSDVIASLSGRGVVQLNDATGSLRIGTTNSGAAGAITVNEGSISPGDDSGSGQTGQLMVGATGKTTNVVFNSGSSLKIDLRSATQYDQMIVAAGNVTLNGGTIEISLLDSFIPHVGDSYDVITASGGISGQFTAVTNTGAIYEQSVVGGNTLRLTVSSVPEPACLSLAGLAVLGLLRRKRACHCHG